MIALASSSASILDAAVCRIARGDKAAKATTIAGVFLAVILMALCHLPCSVGSGVAGAQAKQASPSCSAAAALFYTCGFAGRGIFASVAHSGTTSFTAVTRVAAPALALRASALTMGAVVGRNVGGVAATPVAPAIASSPISAFFAIIGVRVCYGVLAYAPTA